MKKLMKNTRRLIFTICAMCFTVCVIVAGVLATATASFTIKTGASFTASGTLNASVNIEVLNNGDGSSKSDYSEIHNGSSETIDLGTQIFVGTGESNKITFTVRINNYGEQNVRVAFDEITGTSSVDISYSYEITTNTSASVTSTINKQQAVVYQNEYLTLKIVCILLDDSSDINIPINFNFDLVETTDTRETITIPDTGLYVQVNKSNYSVDDVIDSANDITVYYNGQTVSDFTLSEVDMTTAGTKTVTVSYSDPDTAEVYSETYSITITEAPTGNEISSIIINENQVTQDNFLEGRTRGSHSKLFRLLVHRRVPHRGRLTRPFCRFQELSGDCLLLLTKPESLLML